MKKLKFEYKCNELYAYEDEMYAKVLECIKIYNEELNKQGVEIICRLFWFCQNGKTVVYEENRKPINEPREFYKCNIRVQFQKIGADEDDDNEIGFQLFDDVTAYGLSIFTGWSFRKYKMKFIFKNVPIYFAMVRDLGIEKASESFYKKYRRKIGQLSGGD